MLRTTTTNELEVGVGFRNAVDAFKALMDESVIHALEQQYTPPMNLFAAALDAFVEDGAFSWGKTGKLAGAMAIGAFASIFVISPTKTATQTILKAIKDKTGMDLSYKDIITKFCQAATTAESATLATFSGLCLIENYLGYASKAETYLKYTEATCTEKSLNLGRKTFDLLCAAAANVPTFFFAKETNVYLAIFSAIANTSLSWLGVSSLPLTPAKVYPARRVELEYLNEQIETFLKLPFAQQNAIMDEIDGIRSLSDSDDVRHKKIYARMMNLAKPLADSESIQIQEPERVSNARAAAGIALGLYVAAGQINYTESTYIGISGLFSNSSSKWAITSGTIAAAFSLLPNVGFGYAAGSGAADAMLGDNVPLAKLFMSKTREVLKHTINFISMFAGGTAFTVSVAAAKEYAKIMHMKTTLKNILTITEGVVAYTGSSIICAYYTMRLCDEILIYLAQRCGDEQIKRLFVFVLETRRLHKALSDTNEENYLSLLKWKLEGNTELSELFHCVFDNRLSEGEYNKVQQDVNTNGMMLKNRNNLPHYQLIPSFFAKERSQYPGLRKRVCGLFPCGNKETDIEAGVASFGAR